MSPKGWSDGITPFGVQKPPLGYMTRAGRPLLKLMSQFKK
jgi:hypothetical protein